MEKFEKIRELRESTGMNRREFCDYFGIPYRTVTEWERDNRHAPDYVIRLLTYYIQMERLGVKKGSVTKDERTKLTSSRNERSEGNDGTGSDSD